MEDQVQFITTPLRQDFIDATNARSLQMSSMIAERMRLPAGTQWGDLTDSDNEWSDSDCDYDTDTDSDWVPSTSNRSKLIPGSAAYTAHLEGIASKAKAIGEKIEEMEGKVREMEQYIGNLIDESDKEEEVRWQRVQKGARLTRIAEHQAPVSLTTPNRFAALSDHPDTV